MNVSAQKIEEITNQLIILNEEDVIKTCAFINTNTVVFSLLNHHRLFVFGNQYIDLSFATFCEQIGQIDVITPDILVVKTITSVYLLVISKKQQLLVYQCITQKFKLLDSEVGTQVLYDMNALLYDHKTLYICLNELPFYQRKSYATIVLETIDLESLQITESSQAKILVDKIRDRLTYSKIMLAAHNQQLFYCKCSHFGQITQLKPSLGKPFIIYSKELSNQCLDSQRVGNYLFFFFKQHVALQRIDKLHELKEQQNKYDYIFRIQINYETTSAAVDQTSGTIIIGLGPYLYLIREQVLNLYTITDLDSISYQQFHYKYPIIALLVFDGHLEVVHVGKQ